MFVKVMKKGRPTAMPRFGRSRGFAIYELGETETGSGEKVPELLLSREQAEELWRWLGKELFQIEMRVTGG